MALPKLLQKLFQNGGKGPRLREDVMPKEYLPIEGGKIGDQSEWLEQTRPFTETIATVVAKASDGQVAVMGASRSSDNPTANMSTISLYGLSVNDNEINPEPAWAQYLEVRRNPTAGMTLGQEIDMISYGESEDMAPYSLIGTSSKLTINTWLTNGGGDASVNGSVATAAMAVHANPSQWKRGIVFRDGSLVKGSNGRAHAISLPTSYGIEWYREDDTSLFTGLVGAGPSVLPHTNSAEPVNLGIMADGYRFGNVCANKLFVGNVEHALRIADGTATIAVPDGGTWSGVAWGFGADYYFHSKYVGTWAGGTVLDMKSAAFSMGIFYRVSL